MILPIEHIKCGNVMTPAIPTVIIWDKMLQCHIMLFFCYKCAKFVHVKLTDVKHA